MIKRCNDFGAGGVSVAVGELAEGLRIDLSQVRLKYSGLNATEIAISESQERMAVVLEQKDVAAFIQAAEAENLEAYPVATVTEKKRLVMEWRGQVVVDLDRQFLDSAGVRGHADVHVNALKSKNNPFVLRDKLSKEQLIGIMGDLHHASQKGLIETFDSTIGASTVLMPLGGVLQLTPANASVQKFPVLNGETTTCSVLSYGFIPSVFAYSSYLGGQYSIVESLAKTVAVGGNYRTVYLSLQEYFGKLESNAEKWGNVFQALLGAYKVMRSLDLAAIGGKDSMSGTYQEIDVIDTLISFACSPQSVDTIISQELKKAGHYLYLVDCPRLSDGQVDSAKLAAQFDQVHEGIAGKQIVSAMTCDSGSILTTLITMASGNDLGFAITGDEGMLNALAAGSILVESAEPLNHFSALGRVHPDRYMVNGIDYPKALIQNAFRHGLDFIYPTEAVTSRIAVPLARCETRTTSLPDEAIEHIQVLVLVFEGINCEYDSARVFRNLGASVQEFIFLNQTPAQIESSIRGLEQAIASAHILFFPGGFSSGDEPDGSAKYIVNVLRQPRIKQAIAAHLAKKRLILGICNGFQALVKSGLIPYGEVRDSNEGGLTLFRNDIGRHVSTMVNPVVSSVKSPWLAQMDVGDVYRLPVSHGEGKISGDPELLQRCIREGQVVFQYSNAQGEPSMSALINPNGSYQSIEGMVAHEGLILGKMGHSERVMPSTYKGFECELQPIFAAGIAYFRRKNG